MSVADNLVGLALKANKLPGAWKVLSKVERTEKHSGGGFSIGYAVEHTETGTAAFLKASDLDMMTDNTDGMLVRLTAASQMHTFERGILEHCKGNNMDRIVIPLDYGDCLMASPQGVKEPLFWIAFEFANCDARVQRSRISQYDFGWTANAMHNIAIAVEQLHTANVCHNDIKPSNVLVFDEAMQKLGDLGRAISPHFTCLHGKEICLGDPRYASPELLYERDDTPPNFNARKANDLFLLGSLGYFLVCGVMLTPSIVGQLKDEHRPVDGERAWGDGFRAVLPFWRQAHQRAMNMLHETIPTDLRILNKDYGKLFIDAISQLTEPDPELRGHPEERQGTYQSHSLQRYISLFDRLRGLKKRTH